MRARRRTIAMPKPRFWCEPQPFHGGGVLGCCSRTVDDQKCQCAHIAHVGCPCHFVRQEPRSPLGDIRLLNFHYNRHQPGRGCRPVALSIEPLQWYQTCKSMPSLPVQSTPPHDGSSTYRSACSPWFSYQPCCDTGKFGMKQGSGRIVGKGQGLPW